MKTALITGITGQDGSFLARLLVKKGYVVHGIIRRASTFSTGRIEELYRDPHEAGVRLRLHYGDLCDGTGLRRILEKVQPNEVYNLGAQSHVKVSFEQPEYTADAVALGTLRLLEAVRDYCEHSGGRSGSTSRVVGDVRGGAGAAERGRRFIRGVRMRRANGGALVCGELPGGVRAVHRERDSVQPRIASAGETFVTRKVTRAVGRIRHGLGEAVFGNLEARRDWAMRAITSRQCG
jgi:GDPmannose 4,6-dehydratase